MIALDLSFIVSQPNSCIVHTNFSPFFLLHAHDSCPTDSSDSMGSPIARAAAMKLALIIVIGREEVHARVLCS